RYYFFFFFSSRRRHTRCLSDWSSDVCSSDLASPPRLPSRSASVNGPPRGRRRRISASPHYTRAPAWAPRSGSSPTSPRAPPRARSEERRVGKEGRTRGSWENVRKRKRKH